MENTITISLETYKKIMATISTVRTENRKIKHMLTIYKARSMIQHKNICTEYEAYFSPRNSASLDRHSNEIVAKCITEG
jgi:AmiR/NasT family two-component response regulator